VLHPQIIDKEDIYFATLPKKSNSDVCYIQILMDKFHPLGSRIWIHIPITNV